MVLLPMLGAPTMATSFPCVKVAEISPAGHSFSASAADTSRPPQPSPTASAPSLLLSISSTMLGSAPASLDCAPMSAASASLRRLPISMSSSSVVPSRDCDASAW